MWSSQLEILNLCRCLLSGGQNPFHSPPAALTAPEKGLQRRDLQLPLYSLIRCHLETQLSSGLIMAMILQEGWH